MDGRGGCQDLTICRSTSQRLHGSQTRPPRFATLLGARRPIILETAGPGPSRGPAVPAVPATAIPFVYPYVQTVARDWMLFVRNKNAARLKRWPPEWPYRGGETVENEKLVISIASACLLVCPRPVWACDPRSLVAALCCALWSICGPLFAVLFGAARPEANRDWGRLRGYCTHPSRQASCCMEWSGLHIGEQYAYGLSTHIRPRSSSRVKGTKDKAESLSLTHQQKFPQRKASQKQKPRPLWRHARAKRQRPNKV